MWTGLATHKPSTKSSNLSADEVMENFIDNQRPGNPALSTNFGCLPNYFSMHFLRDLPMDTSPVDVGMAISKSLTESNINESTLQNRCTVNIDGLGRDDSLWALVWDLKWAFGMGCSMGLNIRRTQTSTN